jgi:hypothetical protein
MKNGEGGATGAAKLVKNHGAGAVEVTINAQSVQVDDPVLPGRQLLSAGGYNPAADYILIRILKAATELIGLDERIDLRREGPFIFKAFASDRSFNFTIDDRGYVWGAASITEEELRDITGLEDDKIFVLERKSKPDLDLDPGDVVHLDKGGAERLRTRKGTVKVWIDDIEKQIPRGVYTTEQLLQILGVEPGYVLDVVNEHGQLVPLKPGEKLRVKKGMRFISQVPCGGSS